MVCVDGYQVLAAANGPEALAILDRHQGPVQVLLTDVVMPQMPGKQLADKVRAGWPGIQVLFMSGYTQGLLSAQGVLERDVHLIEKPFDQTTLLTKLNEVLRARGVAGRPARPGRGGHVVTYSSLNIAISHGPAWCRDSPLSS